MQIKILNRLEKLKKINFKAIYQVHKKKVAILLLILLLSIVYFSTISARRRMREDAIYWQEQSLLARGFLSGLNSEQKVINLLEQEYKNTHQLIILGAKQDILQLAKDYAQRMNIHIVNIKAYPAQALKYKGNNTAVINSRIVQSRVIEIEAEAGYNNLVRYFDVLYRIAPTLVTVERLKVNKDKNNPDRLKVLMELRFFSLL
jgi:hypothetical protein